MSQHNSFLPARDCDSATVVTNISVTVMHIKVMFPSSRGPGRCPPIVSFGRSHAVKDDSLTGQMKQGDVFTSIGLVLKGTQDQSCTFV